MAEKTTTSYQDLDGDSAVTNTAAAVVAGVEIAGPQPLGEDDSTDFWTQLVPAGARVEIFDLRALGDKLAPYPRRKKGTVHVQDATSFITYVEKHRLPCTEVYADLARMALVGVINAHGESVPDEDDAGTAGHGDHRVSLELMPTESWKAWTSRDKTLMEQVAFAEHLEDNAADVIDPDAATMLEIAQSFYATTAADFKSAQRLSSGEIGFRYQESTNAGAGVNGDLEIPTTFVIAVAPFEGADKTQVTARFRYRLNAGHLKLSYALLDPAGIARQAFLDHVALVRDTLDVPVLQGRPE